LIEAFTIVYKSNKNINLFLTGKGEKNNINKVLKKINKKEGIKYLGYLSDNDFYRFIQDSDILCMVRTKSNFADAGFPFKLGEYLASGNPVIASNVGDVKYYLEDKKDAILVGAGNIEEIQEFSVSQNLAGD